MPEFPELGWNDVPHPVNEQPMNDPPPVHEAVQQDNVDEVQSQECCCGFGYSPTPNGTTAASSHDRTSFDCLWASFTSCDEVEAHF